MKDSIDLRRLLLVLLVLLACVLAFRSRASADVRELHRPILAVWSSAGAQQGNSRCGPCNYFWNDYYRDVPSFRASLDRVYRVVYVDADQRFVEGTLLKGITSMPTFIAPDRRLVGYEDKDGIPAHRRLLHALGVAWQPVQPPPPRTPQQTAPPQPQISQQNQPLADSAETAALSELRQEAADLRQQIAALKEQGRDCEDLKERLQHLEAWQNAANEQQRGHSVPVNGSAGTSDPNITDAAQNPAAASTEDGSTAGSTADTATTTAEGRSWWQTAVQTVPGVLWGPPGALAGMAATSLLTWWFGKGKKPAPPADSQPAAKPQQPVSPPALPTNTVYTQTPANPATVTLPTECPQCSPTRAANSRMAEQLRNAERQIEELNAALKTVRQPDSARSYQTITVDTGLSLARRAIDIIWRSEGAAHPSFARWQKLFEDHVRLLQSGDKTAGA